MDDLTALERLIDPELWLITARDGPDRGGLIATNVSPASIVPSLPRMLVGVARRHWTWELIERSGAFAMHLLAEDHLDWAVRFGTRSGRAEDKFVGVATETGRSGSPLLTGAVGWFDCRVESRTETGDRTVYLAEVLEVRACDPRPVLTAGRMVRLVPDDVRRELNRQREHDAALDSEAILAWRRGRTPGLKTSAS